MRLFRIVFLLAGHFVGKVQGQNVDALPSTLWMAPFLAGGGYASEATTYMAALREVFMTEGHGARVGIRQFAEQPQSEVFQGLPQEIRTAIENLLKEGKRRRGEWDIAVCHSTPDVWLADGAFGWGRVEPCPPPGTRFAVGRTMYETDQLPSSWADRCNRMDEVWVPSDFAVEQFAAAGVDRRRIAVVPEAVDTDFFNPSKYKPLQLPQGAEPGLFRFLSIFKWERRKGWDILLRGYFQEFSAADPVMLYIKTRPFHSDSNFDEKIREHLVSLGSVVKQPLARYTVLSDDIPLKDLPRLYKAADAFVLPTRGEGWGRPHVEAMSMALPVIATNWSGSTAFMSDDYSLPLPIEKLAPVPKGEGPDGHRWAEPSVPALQQLMRSVVTDQEQARSIGKRAREEMVRKYSPLAVAREHVIPQLKRIAKGLPSRSKHEL